LSFYISIALRYLLLPGATSYIVLATKVGSLAGTESMNFDGNFATIDNLLSGTLYQFEVLSVTNTSLRSSESAVLLRRTSQFDSHASSCLTTFQQCIVLLYHLKAVNFVSLGASRTFASCFDEKSFVCKDRNYYDSNRNTT